MKRRRILHFVRAFHLWIGIIVVVYMGLIAISGAVLNHPHSLRLDDHYIRRTWLPARYRAQETAVRADVALQDLRSGLLFGRVGTPMMDAIAGLSVLLLASGMLVFAVGPAAQTGTAKDTDNPKETTLPLRDCTRPFLVARSRPPRAKVLLFKSDR